MPYNPQISYSGDKYIAQGKSNLIQAVLALVGGLNEQSRQAKELRTTLSDVDPSSADQYKAMGLDELRGTANAMEMQSKQKAASLLMQEAQQRLSAGQAAAAAQQQVGPFFQAWQSNMQPRSPMTSGGQSAAGPAAPSMSPLEAALSAAGQYPGGAESSGFGKSLPAILRAMGSSGTGQQGVVPFTLGSENNTLSGGIEAHTGKIILDPETEKRISDARRTSAPASKATAASLPPAGKRVPAKDSDGNVIPGLYDITDSKGTIVGSWSNPHAVKSSGGPDFMSRMIGGNPASVAAPAAAPASKSSGGKFIPGKTYRQGNSLYIYNGESATDTPDQEDFTPVGQ